MKKLLFLILLFVSVQSFGQFTKFFSYNEYLGVWGDSITNIALRDTTVNPFKIGETRFRIADSTVYISISTTASNKWMKLKGYVPTGIGTGTVTSVDASISGALGVTGNPITGIGTLAFTWQGTSAQHVLGNGALSTFLTDVTDITDIRYSPLGHTHSGLVPVGGTTGQILKKNSNTDYDYSWQNEGSGYVASSRELTINGTTYDLSANRSWSVGTVTQSQLDDTAAAIRSDFPTSSTFDTTTIYNNLALKLNKADSIAGGYYPYSTNPKNYVQRTELQDTAAAIRADMGTGSITQAQLDDTAAAIRADIGIGAITNIGDGDSIAVSVNDSTIGIKSFDTSDFDATDSTILIDATLKTAWNGKVDSVRLRSDSLFQYVGGVETFKGKATGSGGVSFTNVTQEFTSSTSLSITLSNTPSSALVERYFLNGVLIKSANVSRTGTTVTFSGFTRDSIDTITAIYSY